MKNIDIQSFRTKLLEEQTEWPKEMQSRYRGEYLFIHDDSKPGFYGVKDLKTGQMVGRVGFKSVEQAKEYAADLIKPQGGRQSSHFEENIDLPGDQENIDVAEPKGKITKADFEKLRAMKNKKSLKKEGGDHEVAMAMSSLKEIVSNASQLMDKLGGMERNIPGWIQDHITNAENYIEQANQGFHEIQ
jgi:hypothetical protein